MKRPHDFAANQKTKSPAADTPPAPFPSLQCARPLARATIPSVRPRREELPQNACTAAPRPLRRKSAATEKRALSPLFPARLHWPEIPPAAHRGKSAPTLPARKMSFPAAANVAIPRSHTPLPASSQTELPPQPLRFAHRFPPPAEQSLLPSNSPTRKYALGVPYLSADRSPRSRLGAPAIRNSPFRRHSRRVPANPSSPRHSRFAARTFHPRSVTPSGACTSKSSRRAPICPNVTSASRAISGVNARFSGCRNPGAPIHPATTESKARYNTPAAYTHVEAKISAM